MSQNKIFTTCSLFVIISLAALFRVPGINWGNDGIPSENFRHLHPDERTHVAIAESFLIKNAAPHKKYIMGYGFQIATVAFLANAFAHEAIPEGQLYYLGRWLSLVYGLGSVLLLYLIINDLSHRRDEALLGALLLAICSLAVTNSHFAVADAANLFWIMLVCFLSYRAISKSSRPYCHGAWAAAGIAISIKLSICALAPLLAIIYFTPNRFRNVCFGGFLFLFAIALGNGFSLGIDDIHGIWLDVFSGNLQIIPHHSTLETLTTILISLAPAFSLPILILSLIGLPATIKSCRANTKAFSCFGIPAVFYFILLLMSDLPFERHLLPFAPVLCGLAATTWRSMIANITFPKKVLWSIPLISYLIFFVIDGEMPFWQENRDQANIWLENNIEAGSTVFLGQYADSLLNRKKYHIVKRGVTKELLNNNIEVIVLHEAHTYRYKRSRLSPFAHPAKDNVYHDQSFYLDYLEPLEEEKLPFSLVRTFICPGQWAVERSFYKKYWGTFSSFVGDLWIYKTPKAKG